MIVVLLSATKDPSWPFPFYIHNNRPERETGEPFPNHDGADPDFDERRFPLVGAFRTTDFLEVDTPVLGQKVPSVQSPQLGRRAKQTRRPCWIRR